MDGYPVIIKSFCQYSSSSVQSFISICQIATHDNIQSGFDSTSFISPYHSLVLSYGIFVTIICTCSLLVISQLIINPLTSLFLLANYPSPTLTYSFHANWLSYCCNLSSLSLLPLLKIIIFYVRLYIVAVNTSFIA